MSVYSLTSGSVKKPRVDISSASLVELRAELSRKRALALSAGSSVSGESDREERLKKSGSKLKEICTTRNKGVERRAQRDAEQFAEESASLDRCKTALEAKTRLYDQLTNVEQGLLPISGVANKAFLVDFEQKALNKIRENRRLPSEIPSQENLVEYEDSFGRTRCCPENELVEKLAQTKDLMRNLDTDEYSTEIGIQPVNGKERIIQTIANAEYDDDKDKTESCAMRESIASIGPQLSEAEFDTPEELYRRTLHAKWDAQDEAKGVDEPTRYQDVLYDEVRQHGSGYYSFSKDKEAREEQMARLQELNEQTAAGKARRERLLERRQLLASERLAKVRARKGIIVPPEEPSAEDAALSKAVEQEQRIESKLREMRQSASKRVEVQVTRLDYSEDPQNDASFSCIFPRRDWDREKFTMPPSLLAKKELERQELLKEAREAEFAPPPSYYY